MIADFKEWVDELRSNKLWYYRVKEIYPRKNLMAIAQQVHAWLIAKEDERDWPSVRTLFMKFANDAPDGTVILNTNVEEPVKNNWEPTSEERRKRWLKVFEWRVSKAKHWKPAPKTTLQKLEEEGGVRPKSAPFVRSDIEKIMIAKESVKIAREVRRKVFLEAYPSAEPEEVEAYVMKFESTDNPDGLHV